MRNAFSVKLVKLAFVVTALAILAMTLGDDPWGPW